MLRKYFNFSKNFAQIRIMRMRKCENATDIFTMRMRCECDDFLKSQCECDANANLSHRIASHSQNAKIAMRIYIPDPKVSWKTRLRIYAPDFKRPTNCKLFRGVLTFMNKATMDKSTDQPDIIHIFHEWCQKTHTKKLYWNHQEWLLFLYLLLVNNLLLRSNL